MVRVYKRKTNRCDAQSDDKIISAVRMVIDNEKSIRSQAEAAGISPMTLCRYIKKTKAVGIENIKIGYDNKQQVFTLEQENKLVKYILDASKIYFGLSPKEVRALAYECAHDFNISMPENWKDNKSAGPDWLALFMRRHNSLSTRVPEATSLSRASSFNRTNVKLFFSKLTEVMDKHHFAPHQIWNIDETGVTTVQKPRVILAEKGVKQVGAMTSGERGTLVTLCCAVSATGNAIPPMFVFPRTHFKDHFIRDGPTGCTGSAHPSGWMTADNFLIFLQHFVSHARPSKDHPVLLLLDNHHSHIAVDILNFAKENGIVMLSFPPHCSHKLQPLDRTVFGPLKRSIATVMDSWMRSNPGKCITIYNIPSIVRDAWPKATLSSNISKGFEVAGIYPYNQEVFQDSDFAPSFVTDRPNPNTPSQDEFPKDSIQSDQAATNAGTSRESAIAQGEGNQSKNDSFSTTEEHLKIENALQEIGFEVCTVRGDGHCLINAFLKCLDNEDIGAAVEFNETTAQLNDEFESHSEYYKKFATEGNDLRRDLKNYIQYKQYNTETVDLVLTMLCNIFKVRACVLQWRDGKISLIEVQPGCPGIQIRGKIHLVLFGQDAAAHYNALKKIVVDVERNDEVHQRTPVNSPPHIFCPESVRPFPKAQSRSMVTKGRKKRKSVILTDTPEIIAIELEQTSKRKKGADSRKKKKRKPAKNNNR